MSGLIALVLFVALIPSSNACGQDGGHHLPEAITPNAPVLRFERLSIEDGLAQQSVTALEQDRQGYLWIGTQDGLHRYDGHEFKVYTSIPFDTTSLSGNYIYGISEGIDGYLWVSSDGGLNRFDPETGKSVVFKHDPSDSTSLPSNIIFDVLAGSNGDVWAATSRSGIARMRRGETGRFERISHVPDDPSTITDDRLAYLQEDPQGYIWAGSLNGINRIDPRTGEVTRFLMDPKDDPFAMHHPTAAEAYVRPGQPDVAWIATSNGLVRLERTFGELGPHVKQMLSHRSRAMRAIVPEVVKLMR